MATKIVFQFLSILLLLAQWRPQRIQNRHKPIFNLLAIISGAKLPEW
jgi:hypothetical protein